MYNTLWEKGRSLLSRMIIAATRQARRREDMALRNLTPYVSFMGKPEIDLAADSTKLNSYRKNLGSEMILKKPNQR